MSPVLTAGVQLNLKKKKKILKLRVLFIKENSCICKSVKSETP